MNAVHALERPPQNGADLLEADPVLQEALFLALLQRGVYTAPRGSINLGLAITEWDLDHYLNALDESLGRTVRHDVEQVDRVRDPRRCRAARIASPAATSAARSRRP